MTSVRADRSAARGAPKDGAAPVLELRGLLKVFGKGDKAVRAVDGVDLTVHAGEVVALLGPNGAGKTTTIKMTAGLVTPTAGEVRVSGVDLLRHRGAAVRHLGAVLEGGRNVYWPLSAWQNLLYFGRLRGLRRRDIEPRVEWLLRELDLWDRRHESVGTFSRGMQQKVAVSAALVTDPLLILLDEPTIGLDVVAARTVKDWIRRLAAEEGRAVVLTTHQLAVAQELADRVVVIRQQPLDGDTSTLPPGGRIVADLPVSELLDGFREDTYEVVVDAPPAALRRLPAGAELVDGVEETTIVVGDDPDALHRLFGSLARRRVRLISVSSHRPDLEDVFLRLIGDGR